MTILSALYQLLIGPLELFFEVVFSIANRVIDNPGLSIIVLSLAMNFLVLPLYRQADAMQEAERDRSNAMKPWVDHIKKTFKGDERFMMLQTYYRQNNYKQTDALNGSVSLLLEIPFFIAAYHFLSNLEVLRGVSFGPIVDLGAPDGLLVLGGVTINVLPILMTAINVVSAAIYMKGFPLKSKVQMYGIAAIFLVLLYASPAGLVFYWTLNNLFSLVKNVFYKLKNPRLVLGIIFSAVGLVGLVVVLFVHPLGTTVRQGAVIAFCVLMQLPLALNYLGKPGASKKPKEVTKEESRIFLYSCIFLALLTGVLIPSAVIASSPLEFVDISNFKSPLWYVVNSACIAVGTFVIWFGIFYRLASPSGKRAFSALMWVAAVAAVADYMFFGTGYGTLSTMLIFDNELAISMADKLVNLLAILVVAGALAFVWVKKNLIVRAVVLSMCLAAVGMSAMNIAGIQQAVFASDALIEAADQGEPYIPLSKDGNNVVVIMLDRSVSEFLPYMMNEVPELKEMLAGFTYYPNAVSYGSSTNVGAPALYGGYEYTPENMNGRPDESLCEKTNEALLVMPVLFEQNGYQVTVFDPSYAGYSWIPDLSIYDAYPDIRKYITMDGSFTARDPELAGLIDSDYAEKTRSRNFFCYSVFRISPLALQPTLYDYGRYNSGNSSQRQSIGEEAQEGSTLGEAEAPRTLNGVLVQEMDGLSRAVGIDAEFMKSYAVLDNLVPMTVIVDSDDDTFLMMSNDTTHEPTLLDEPSYTPQPVIDNTAYDEAHQKRYNDDGGYLELSTEKQMRHYHINMAAFLKLGEWFDYLRENGVYDNTKIIIVSDHARAFGYHPEMGVSIEDGTGEKRDVSVFNCMLLVKDFSADTFSVDEQFMTNADTPVLAMADVIEDPVNPFTGNPIDSSDKDKPEQHVQLAEEWSTDVNNGNVFLPGYWFSVHDDVRVSENWEYVGYY